MDPILLLICAFFLIALSYFYYPLWSVRRIPGPTPIPFIGNLHLLAKNGPFLFTLLARRHGPVFKFHMGRQPVIVVADAEICREVGVKKFKLFANRSIPAPIQASPLHKKGLFWTKNERWSIMRNTILSVYQPSHLAKLIPTMQHLIESATENLDSKDFNFSEFSLKLATDVIGKAAFGFNFGLSQKEKMNNTPKVVQVQEFVNQHIYSTTELKMDLSGSFSIILGLLIPCLQEPFRRILRRIPGSKDWRFDQTNMSLSNHLEEIVCMRMNDMHQGCKDFLSLIISARDSETSARDMFTDDYITAVTYEHLLAGSTTTAFTFSSVVYLVSCHPEVEKKVIEEIDSFGPHDQLPNADDLEYKFPYLDQVIKEAMRFYTVSPLVAREASTQVEIGGYTIPKGTWVWLALGVLAKDPKNFPEPEKFKPERFDVNFEEEMTRHPYANIPLGLGPSACIGRKFALQEIKLCLIHLYRKYVFRHSPAMEKPVELQYGIVLNFKHGVKVTALKRT